MSYSNKIQEVLDSADVALFMKGTPDAIMCGNSERALGALRRAGAPITAVDILVDGQIREDLSAISGWPTIPQVFVKGELVGGADIVEELERSGELEQTLADVDALSSLARPGRLRCRCASAFAPCPQRRSPHRELVRVRAPDVHGEERSDEEKHRHDDEYCDDGIQHSGHLRKSGYEGRNFLPLDKTLAGAVSCAFLARRLRRILVTREGAPNGHMGQRTL